MKADAEFTSEPGADGKPQLVIPGAEHTEKPAATRIDLLTEAARAYRTNHHFVSLRLQGKNPNVMGNGWTRRTLKSPIPAFHATDNIGILLGAPSGDIVRLDPDFKVIDQVTDILFPEPTLTSGRKSAPCSGRLYICKGLKSKDFRLPKVMEHDPRLPFHNSEPSLTVLQILSNGKQHMAPPSIHPESGEEIVWQSDAALATLEAADFLRRAGLEAFLLAVRHFWPARGARNEAAMALARTLLEATTDRWPNEEQRIAAVDALVLAVAMAGGDGEDSRNGKARATATLAKMKAGEETIGLPRLVELLELPKDVLPKFRQWIGMGGVVPAFAGICWRECRKNGAPIASMHNARLAITALGIQCSRDTFHNKMLFGFRGDEVRHELQALLGEVTDNGIISLRQIMSDRFGFDLGDKATRDAVVSLTLEHCFDPVRDMLDKAQGEWDGIERLDEMAVTYFNAEDTPLNRAIVRKTMIAAVRRARKPGCKFDNITVLESPEGWNKSTAWRVLAGDENFSDASILGHAAREVQEQLSEVWIHENADLAGMRKAEIETVKTFASRQSDDARPAYGYFLKKQKRHSIETGTTNSDEYLQSQTGNRRFWPLAVLKMIDIEQLKRDRLLLWGEAARYEADGESITLAEDLWSKAGEEQEKRRTKDPWEEIVADIPQWVEVAPVSPYAEATQKQIIFKTNDLQMVKETVAAADLLLHVLDIPTGRQTTNDAMRLANAMRHAGWERGSGKVTVNGVRVRGFFRWKAPP
jgi:predicted P-loop ATPase